MAVKGAEGASMSGIPDWTDILRRFRGSPASAYSAILAQKPRKVHLFRRQTRRSARTGRHTVFQFFSFSQEDHSRPRLSSRAAQSACEGSRGANPGSGIRPAWRHFIRRDTALPSPPSQQSPRNAPEFRPLQKAEHSDPPDPSGRIPKNVQKITHKCNKPATKKSGFSTVFQLAYDACICYHGTVLKKGRQAGHPCPASFFRSFPYSRRTLRPPLFLPTISASMPRKDGDQGRSSQPRRILQAVRSTIPVFQRRAGLSAQTKLPRGGPRGSRCHA